MGLISAFVAAVSLTARDLVSKRVSDGVDDTLSAFASFLFALPFYCILLLVLWLLGFENFAFSGAFFLLVFLRSSTDAVAEWLKMKALRLGDISLVSPLFSLTPLFLLIASPLITGDPVSSHGVMAICIIVIGTLIVGYTPNRKGLRKQNHWAAILSAIGAAVFLSLNACFDRLAVQVASPSLSAATMTLMAAVFLLPFCRQGISEKQLSANSKWFSIRGFFEVGFMVLKLYALQTIPAHYVTGLTKVALLFSIIGGKLAFDEENFVQRLVGGSLILVGIILIIGDL